jgi:O-antigen ligase
MSTDRPELRVLGLVVLVGGSALATPIAWVSGVTMTGDRLLGVAALLTTVALGLGRRVSWTPVHSALALFVAVQGLTALANAPTWPRGLRFVVVYAFGFGCAVVAAELARSAAGLAAAGRVWCLTGAAVGAVAAAIALAATLWQKQLWGTGWALLANPGDRTLVLYAAKLTFPEWNLLSSFLLVPFALVLWRLQAWTPGAMAVLGAIAAGLVFGMTRAAWFAAAAMIAVWAWQRRPARRLLVGLGLIVGLALAAQALTGGASAVVARLVLPLATGSDFNLTSRAVINRAAFRSWLESPVLGKGAGSTNRLRAELPQGEIVRRLWTGNLVLFVLHDSGVLGLAAFLALIGVTARQVAVAAARGAARWREMGPPLLVSGIALLWAWQFTHALWLMYPYVHLGLLIASTRADGDT